MKSDQYIQARIEKEYNYKVIIREISLIAVVYLYALIFPQAFEQLDYPFYLMMLIISINALIYIFAIYKIRKLKKDFELNRQIILQMDKLFYFLTNYSIALLIPALGGQFINIFWFITAINFCMIFSSPYNQGKKMIFVYLAPILSYLLHVFIYYFQGKGIYGIEAGFALLMCCVFYYTHLSINQKKVYEKMTSDGDKLYFEFCDHFSLTDRERDVLDEIFKGKTNRQIGELLFISAGTVRNHLSNIFEKTGTHSRMELLSLFNSYR